MVHFNGNYPIIDDIGSFPLGEHFNHEMFYNLYWDTYNAFVKGIDIPQNRTVQRYVTAPIEQSFKRKIESGLDIVTYPQHVDMNKQFLKPIEDYETEPFTIDPSKAYVIEMELLKEYAKTYYEMNGSPLIVKSCVTGPLELYQQKQGFAVYKDIALNLATSVNAFLKNAIFDEKYIKTAVVSVDEPSIGLVTFNQVENDDITDILEKSVQGLKSDVQIHLHSLNSYQLVLNVKKINVLTCEYATDQKNIIPKKDLETFDKFIRVGVSRTSIGALISEQIEKGQDSRKFERKDALMTVIDSKERIQKRYNEALERYGDRLKYVGPDCGLKSWKIQDVAYQLLETTCEAVKECQNRNK